MVRSSKFVAAAVAGIFVGAMALADDATAPAATQIKCKGGNACAGQSACGKAKGKNSCAGTGLSMASDKAACKADRKAAKSAAAAKKTTNG